MSEGRLELPAFAFVARCDDPISLLRRWGVLRELNSELQSHILPCCRYTKDATENGGVYGIRTREIPDRQSGGVDHWPNTPRWRRGHVPTVRGSYPASFPAKPVCQFQHLSKYQNGGVGWIRTTTGTFAPYWRFSKPLPYQIRLTTPKMAEEENFEISHGIATVTSGFQDRPLAFRVTLP